MPHNNDILTHKFYNIKYCIDLNRVHLPKPTTLINEKPKFIMTMHKVPNDRACLIQFHFFFLLEFY